MALLALFMATAAACHAIPKPSGSVLVQTRGGVEQGASTPYGVVFLGRTAQDGPCEVTMFFGDGPSIEPGRIREIQPGLFKIDIDLRPPISEISYTYPFPDDDLLIGLVNGTDTRFYSTELADGTGATGTAVRVPSGFPRDAAASGAPLYRMEDGRYRLVGLITGIAQFNGTRGSTEVLTYLGPKDLIPLALLDHDHGRARTPPRREDVLR